MGAAADLDKNVESTRELDEKFLKCIKGIAMASMDNAKSCTDKVFDISSNFLNRDATVVLEQFKGLYFGDAKSQEKKEAMNRDVDDMISQIQANLDEGKDAEEGVEEAESLKTQRLALSAVQKKLEGLITLDKGIKEKVLPALSTMQFEDAVRQRVTHILDAWELVATSLVAGEMDVTAVAEKIGESMSSVAEAEVYFPLILNRDPPEGAYSGDAFLF